jgi:hypothetical protein
MHHTIDFTDFFYLMKVVITFITNHATVKRICAHHWTMCYFNDVLSPIEKGAGTLLHVLHVCYSFRQKCSKLGTHTTQGLKDNFDFAFNLGIITRYLAVVLCL